MEKNKSSLWKCLLPSLVVVGLQYFFAEVFAFVAFLKNVYEYTEGSYVDFLKKCMDAVQSVEYNTAVNFAYALAGIIIFSIWYKKGFSADKSEKKRLFSFTKKPLYIVGGAVLLVFGMQYICTYVMNILAILFPKWLAMYQQILETAGFSDEMLLPLVIYTVLIGPVCEELVFRGITLGHAKNLMPFWAANIFQAILFAAMHMNPLQAAYTFLVGITLGYFVHRTGSIFMGILLHIAFNAVGVIGNSLIVSGNGPVQMYLIVFASLVLTYVGFILIDRNINTES